MQVQEPPSENLPAAAVLGAPWGERAEPGANPALAHAAPYEVSCCGKGRGAEQLDCFSECGSPGLLRILSGNLRPEVP